MRVVDIIEKKKNNKALSEKEIKFLINGYVSGEIADYQMSAFTMAVCFNGMNEEEIIHFTKAMMHSGDILDLSKICGIKVDKHSTGGVGDKTTLALVPIIASFDIPIVKMSGRGLGFTGGTLDKLESIPGFNVNLSVEQLINQVNKIKVAVIAQIKGIVPADKKLYALRDVTATVNSLPLIASSIMSKKLATGSDVILLDVKCGNGAFMKTVNEAKKLAEIMIKIGKGFNKDVRVEITSMSSPLGKAIGNKNEVLEAIDTLKGNGPHDFQYLIIHSAATMLLQAKKFYDIDEAIKAVENNIENGKALNKFYEWIDIQGGNVNLLQEPNNFWTPKYKHEVKSSKNGFMKITSAVDFGLVAMKLGAGRKTKKDPIDFEAGIMINKQTNDEVKEGDILFTLYSSKEIISEIIESLNDSYIINKNKVDEKLIMERIGNE